MDDPNAPSIWLIMAAGMTLMFLFIFFLWIVNKIAAWLKGGTHAPTVRRRRPVISRPLRADAVAPDRLGAAVARIVRTAEHARTALARGAVRVQTGAEVPSTPDLDLPHSPEELYQLAQIILHKQRGRSKADAIRDVTGILKGGNPKYMRWSRMVDLATEPPSRYREYTPEMMAVLQPKPNAQDN
jgi:hypothetical protein